MKAVELAFLKERSRGGISRAQLALTPTAAGEYRTAMRERLEGLIGRVRDLLATEVYRPNPAANCFHCELQAALSPVAGGPAGPARGGGVVTLPAGDRRGPGRRAHGRAVAGDLDAARAVRRGRGRRLGQDVGDGGARRVPGAGGAGARGGRPPRRAARQRPVPDVHEQGHREPEPARPARAAGARPGRGRGADDPQLPRVRRAGHRAARPAGRDRARASASCRRRSARSCARACSTR